MIQNINKLITKKHDHRNRYREVLHKLSIHLWFLKLSDFLERFFSFFNLNVFILIGANYFTVLYWRVFKIINFLSVVISFILKSVLSDMHIATPAFFWFTFKWNLFSQPLTFTLYISLGLKYVYCKPHIYGYCFCIHSVSVYPLVGAFNPFHLG